MEKIKIPKIPDEAIVAATKWWTERISKKVVHDNGDNSFGSIFAGMLADQGVEVPDQEALAVFKEELLARLVEKTSRQRSIYLDCDYSPCAILAFSAKEAGISPNNFPWKVSMRINGDRVIVKDGYGSPWETIWPVQNSETEAEGGEGA